MPYVRSVAPRKITLPSNKHYWVEWRDVIRYGDIKAATQKAIKMNAQGEPEMDSAAYADAMLLAHINGWNLDDEEGSIMPVNEDTLSLLEYEDSNYLAGLAAGEVKDKEKTRKN